MFLKANLFFLMFKCWSGYSHLKIVVAELQYNNFSSTISLNNTSDLGNGKQVYIKVPYNNCKSHII